MQIHRREFLRAASAAGAGAAAGIASPAIQAADGPTRTYSTAIIGSGWWGMNILGEAIASGSCRVSAMCDVDERILLPAREKVEKLTGSRPAGYRDFRELLEKERPEIVIVATPDHWHPLQTIAAVRSGAHVYVEKPVGHTIREGRAMVKAAREAGRVVQVGTHRRVSPHNVSGREFIRSGKLGKIGMVRSFVHYGGGPERPVPNMEPPKEIDWDLWCGPAPLRHYCQNFPQPWGGAIHPRGFRGYLDFANGTLGDWGVHWMDQILWIMEEKWPRRVFSAGGRPVRGPAVYTREEQTSDAPDHQVAVFEFEGFTATWEHRAFAGNNAEKGENVGCYFYGTEGTLHIGWQAGWTFYPADGSRPVLHEEPRLGQPDSQNIKELWADFLACVRSGRRPVADIEEVHRSTNMSLLAMLSLRLGRAILWDGEKESAIGDAEANALLRRTYRKGWEYPES